MLPEFSLSSVSPRRPPRLGVGQQKNSWGLLPGLQGPLCWALMRIYRRIC